MRRMLPTPKAAAINICLIHPANLLRLVPNEIEKTLFFKMNAFGFV